MKINKLKIEADLAKFILDCKQNNLEINLKRIIKFIKTHEYFEIRKLLPASRKTGRRNKLKIITEALTNLNATIQNGVTNAKV